MGFSNEKRLERWVRQQAFGGWEDRLCTFVIEHVGVGKATVVFEKTVEGILAEHEITPMVEFLWETIMSDVEGLGATQKYMVKAMREGRETPSGRFTCRVMADNDEENDLDGTDTEPPTKAGIQAQQMRHNEALMKTFAGTVQAMLGSMARMTQQQAEQIEKLTEQRFKSLEVIENAMTQQAERELASMSAMSAEDRKDKMVNTLMMLAPAVVNKLGGKKLLPEASSPKDMMLKNLIDSLEPEQFAKLSTALTAEQQVLLVQVIQTFKAEEQHASPPTSPSNGS